MIRWVFRPLTQLWASICTSERPSDLHLIFTRLHPRRVKIIIFRVVSELISLRSFKKIRTGTICQGSSPLLSYLLSLRIIGFSTTILSTLMHSLIRVSRRDEKGWAYHHSEGPCEFLGGLLLYFSTFSQLSQLNKSLHPIHQINTSKSQIYTPFLHTLTSSGFKDDSKSQKYFK